MSYFRSRAQRRISELPNPSGRESAKHGGNPSYAFRGKSVNWYGSVASGIISGAISMPVSRKERSNLKAK